MALWRSSFLKTCTAEAETSLTERSTHWVWQYHLSRIKGFVILVFNSSGDIPLVLEGLFYWARERESQSYIFEKWSELQFSSGTFRSRSKVSFSSFIWRIFLTDSCRISSLLSASIPAVIRKFKKSIALHSRLDNCDCLFLLINKALIH